MITMFAAVAQRVGEIGTLRALGFRRNAILLCLLDGVLAAVFGGWSAWIICRLVDANCRHLNHQLPNLQ